MRRDRIFMHVLVLVGIFSSSARADPVALRSFDAVITTEGTPGREIFLTLEAPGLSFSGETDRSITPASILSPCGSCEPGDVASFTSTQLLSFNPTRDSFITIGGTVFPLLFVDSTLHFMSPAVRVPPPVDGVSHITTSLRVNGQLSLLVGDFGDPNTRRELMVEMNGTGKGSARFFEDGFPGVLFAAVALRFGSEPAAVPEPSTLLLLGGGITGMAARRWKRIRMRVPDSTRGARWRSCSR